MDQSNLFWSIFYTKPVFLIAKSGKNSNMGRKTWSNWNFKWNGQFDCENQQNFWYFEVSRSYNYGERQWNKVVFWSKTCWDRKKHQNLKFDMFCSFLNKSLFKIAPSNRRELKNTMTNNFNNYDLSMIERKELIWTHCCEETSSQAWTSWKTIAK